MSLIQEALERAKAAREGDVAVPHELPRRVPDKSGPTVLKPGRRRSIEIDWDALRAGGLLAPVTEDNLIARQLRDIKRPLIAHAFGKRATSVAEGNLIMVTSALAGEGKTFISFNLARSMAEERDHSVLLVDADVAKPHTSKLFGLPDAPGLLDVLEFPDVLLESVIVDTDTRGLSILTVSELDRFVQAGGMIQFVIEGNKVRFEINDQAAREANLRISSKLLSVARPSERPP